VRLACCTLSKKFLKLVDPGSASYIGGKEGAFQRNGDHLHGRPIVTSSASFSKIASTSWRPLKSRGNARKRMPAVHNVAEAPHFRGCSASAPQCMAALLDLVSPALDFAFYGLEFVGLLCWSGHLAPYGRGVAISKLLGQIYRTRHCRLPSSPLSSDLN